MADLTLGKLLEQIKTNWTLISVLIALISSITAFYYQSSSNQRRLESEDSRIIELMEEQNNTLTEFGMKLSEIELELTETKTKVDILLNE